MARQKPSGRGGSGGARQGSAGRGPASGAARQTANERQGGGRSGNGRSGGTGQGTAKTTTKPGGNGAATGKSRPAGNGSSPARAASAGTAAARPGSAGLAASQLPAGPMGRLLAPFRSMGGLPLATLILSLYGLGASIYLTLAHYDTHITLACSDNGIVNCAEVTTSSQSMVFGIFPVAVLGLAFYIFMVAINSPWGWRLQQPAARWARLGSVVVGMGFVLYLIFAEVIQIGAICLWCTSVHVATFLIFALIVFHASFSWGKPVATGRA